MEAPKAKKIDHKVSCHGDTYNDEYHWIRYIDEDKDVREYIEKENAFTDNTLKDDKDFREALFQELKGRHLETYTTSKYPHGNYFYYSRYEKGKEYAIHCRQKDLNSPEEIILDENILAEDQEYFELGSFSLSHDHKLLAYSYDNNGSEKFTIEVKNLELGKNLNVKIPNAYYGIEWYADNMHFTYVLLDDNLRPYQVKQHKLGKSCTRRSTFI